eukprot:710694-Lingulodinium_polyedra.AAC.1
MFRGRSGSPIARVRVPCAGQFSARAWGARECGPRAIATARCRLDHIIAQLFAKRCALMRSSRHFEAAA